MNVDVKDIEVAEPSPEIEQAANLMPASEAENISFEAPSEELPFEAPAEGSSFEIPAEESPFDAPAEESPFEAAAEESSIDVPEEVSPFEATVDAAAFEATSVDLSFAAPPFEQTIAEAEKPACPFCHSEANAGGFECGSCHSVLTLSDIEALLSNPNVDADAIRASVAAMEAGREMGEFNADQLTLLSIGHFNLGNLSDGFRYLQEASSLDPNNVILAANVNTVAIRLDEMSRRTDPYDNMPKGKSILVIDDSATVRKLISGKLEKSGHTVICAVDGVDGLERIAEQMPDLVLLDIGMPRMDGYEVCRQIRASDTARNLPVVMISGKDGFFDKVRGKMAGATGYVTKPFGPETLMKALDTYLSADFSPLRPDDNDAKDAVTDELTLNA
jgi:twitching motility two-component system response regulator PilG